MGERADAVLQAVDGARNELIGPAIDLSAGNEGAHRYDGLRGASIELLRDICCIGLEPGEIWRPCVTAHMNDSHWFWIDAGDDMPERHGPFRSEEEALLNAIAIEGIEEPQSWGLSSRPVLEAEAEGRAWTMANMLAAKDALLQAGWTKDRDAPALYRKEGETFELNSGTIQSLPVGDANPERDRGGLPAFASRFGDADRYSVPVESRLVLFLPLTPFRPEPMRVTERSAANGNWYEVETYDARRDLWIEQKQHNTAQAAMSDARCWYPNPAEGSPTVTFPFNDRAQGIFADGYKDRFGNPVADTFAYRLRASIYGAEGKNWTTERLGEFVEGYSSEEMAMLMNVSPGSRHEAPIEAESATTLSTPGEAVSEDEVLRALESMGEQPTASRTELLRELVDEKWWPTVGREVAVREAVDAARKHLDDIPGGQDGLLTARAVREAYPTRNLPSSVVKVLYAVRRVQVNKLETQPEIGVDELAELDRLGRFRVADELFGKCNPQARHALLNDAHPHVQSAARLSMDLLAAKGEPMRRAADEAPSPEF